MTNKTLIFTSKTMLKELLSQCTEPQQHLFKRMYSHKNVELSINEVVDNLDDDKVDWAFTQVENTIKK